MHILTRTDQDQAVVAEYFDLATAPFVSHNNRLVMFHRFRSTHSLGALAFIGKTTTPLVSHNSRLMMFRLIAIQLSPPPYIYLYTIILGDRNRH